MAYPRAAQLREYGQILMTDGRHAMTADFDAGTKQFINVADPETPDNVVTKNYLDNYRAPNSNLEKMGAYTIKGNKLGSEEDPQNISFDDLVDALPSFKSATTMGGVNGKQGLVPIPTNNDYNKFLRGDGTWAAIPECTVADEESLRAVLLFAGA